jgi:hypothetical protein
VLTSLHDLKVKLISPASGKGLHASPEFRIVGRGNSAQLVPIHAEVETIDFATDPKSRERMIRLEEEYLKARRDAVTLVRVNLSLAIRNAFDRLEAVRARPRPA